MSTTDLNAKPAPADARRFTLVERNNYSIEVNRITGLDELSAKNVEAILQTGSAYQDDPETGRLPWTCQVIAEPSTAEELAELARDWFANSSGIDRADVLAEALRYVASRLDSLGSTQIGRTSLGVELHVSGTWAMAPEQAIATVDLLAAAFGLSASKPENMHYNAHSSGHPGGVRVVTTSWIEPGPECSYTNCSSELADVSCPVHGIAAAS